MINNDDIAPDNLEFIAESNGSGPDNDNNSEMQAAAGYSEDDIKTLDWKEHIRRRPGMYIGCLLYTSDAADEQRSGELGVGAGGL